MLGFLLSVLRTSHCKFCFLNIKKSRSIAFCSCTYEWRPLLVATVAPLGFCESAAYGSPKINKDVKKNCREFN